MATNSNICRTAVGISVQAAKLLGRPHEYLKYTTLNERFDILPEAHLDLTTLPDLKYYVIGYGGHRNHVEDDGLDIANPVSHVATNTSLYKPMPFVLRQINDDLPNERRKNYALRRKETYNGIDYWAYYAKRLPKNTTAAEVLEDRTEDGVTETRPFLFTANDLYPTPPELPETGVIVASNDIVRISSRVTLDFNALDVEEYINAVRIIRGSEKGAIISEIAVCTGTDKDVQVEGSKGQSITMTEAIGVQVATFITTYQQVNMNNYGFTQEFDIGAGEPLLTQGQARTTRYSADVKPTTGSSHLTGTIYDASNPRNSTNPVTTAELANRTSTAGTPTGENTNTPGTRSDN